MSFHGLQVEIPKEKERNTLKMAYQMIYQRKVSKKKRMRSMMYMMVRVKAAWFAQRVLPTRISLHP
jgi:hypothetical protein